MPNESADQRNEWWSLPREPYITDDDGDPTLVQVSHMVPKSIKEEAQKNSGYGELSDAVRDVYRVFASGKSHAGPERLRHELRKLQNDRERIESEIEDLQAEVTLLNEQEEELKERLVAAEERGPALEELLGELEADIYEGMAVFPSHGRIESVSRATEYSPTELIALLKERNPELPEAAFMPQDELTAMEKWAGLADRDTK